MGERVCGRYRVGGAGDAWSCNRKVVVMARPNFAGKYAGKRYVPGEMNKTESNFADALTALKIEGRVLDWKFEPLKLRIGAKCFLTMDFLVLYDDGILELVDVKGTGPIAEDSIVKIKAAAALHPWFRFVIEKKQKDGGWLRTEY